jgi:predicted nucleotidyltransferase
MGPLAEHEPTPIGRNPGPTPNTYAVELESESRSMIDRGTARVSEQLKAALSREPRVLAIFRNGSTVAGTDQPGSDLDFLVIVQRKTDRGRALKRLKQHFRFLSVYDWCASFAGRRKPDITIFDRPSVDRLLRLLYRSPDDLVKVQNTVQHKIVEAVPIYDPLGLLEKYQAKASAYPERIRRAVFDRAIRSLRNAEENWESRNELNFAFDFSTILEAICTALYARNRRLLMLPFKRLHRDLKELRPNIESEVYRLARSGRSGRSRQEGRAVLKRIIRKLTSGM